jgi:hypothetical protein
MKPIVILKLGENQSIDVTCLAKKGKGKQHVKWSPHEICALKIEPVVMINERIELGMTDKQKEQFVQICPKKVFSFSR